MTELAEPLGIALLSAVKDLAVLEQGGIVSYQLFPQGVFASAPTDCLSMN